MTVAMQPRSTPGMRPTLKVAAAKMPPVLPSETTASALPSLDQFRRAGDGTIRFLAKRAGGFVLHLHDFAGVDDAHTMVAKTAGRQGGVDFGLIADQIEGGDFLVVFQCPPDALDDDSAPVVATHDIHCNSHR